MRGLTLLFVLNAGCSPQTATASVPNNNQNKIIRTLTIAPQIISPTAPIVTPTVINTNTLLEMQVPYSRIQHLEYSHWPFAQI